MRGKTIKDKDARMKEEKKRKFSLIISTILKESVGKPTFELSKNRIEHRREFQIGNHSVSNTKNELNEKSSILTSRIKDKYKNRSEIENEEIFLKSNIIKVKENYLKDKLLKMRCQKDKFYI